MRTKIILIVFLAIFSFLNNLIISFDSLQEMTNQTDVEVFLQTIDPNINCNQGYIRLIIRYLIYFVFFFDINDIKSVKNLYEKN